MVVRGWELHRSRPPRRKLSPVEGPTHYYHFCATQAAMRAREVNPSFFRILRTRFSTVRSEIESSEAIRRLVGPLHERLDTFAVLDDFGAPTRIRTKLSLQWVVCGPLAHPFFVPLFFSRQNRPPPRCVK